MARGRDWSSAELHVLETVYVERGVLAAMAQLPGRSDGAIFQKAFKLGLKCAAQGFPRGSYREISEEAWRLRHEENLSYSSIGHLLGVCEAQATNAVLYAECIKAGHTPLQRHGGGRLHAEGRVRLRTMFRKGWTHRRIQEWTGCPAATLTRERKLYDAELKAKGLAPLPPIGGGLRYPGAKIPRDLRRAVERLYLEGFGTATVSRRTAVSKTHCLRTRQKLINRLRRKGECLPGCDIKGRRLVVIGHRRHIPPELIAHMRRLLLKGGASVAKCAEIAGIGSCSGYKIFHQLKAEMEAQGRALPMPDGRLIGGSKRERARDSGLRLPGPGQWGLMRYRRLVHDGMAPAVARKQVVAEAGHRDAAEREKIEARRRQDAAIANNERARPKSIEDQIRLIEQRKATIYVDRPMLPTEPLFSGASSSLA